MEHAMLSPSSATRWINCTPSAKLESKEENTTSVYAEEGTLAHHIGELKLRLHFKQISQSKYNSEIKKAEKHELFKREMHEHTDKYVSYVIEEFNTVDLVSENAQAYIEVKANLSNYVPESFGTSDTAIVCKDSIHIIDLKYGKGIKVDAMDNSQLRLYALGLLDSYKDLKSTYNIKKVKMSIVQPRLDHISEDEISAEELINWGENIVRPAAKKAFEGKGLQKAGAWCRFCKVKAKCSTIASENMKLARHEFKDPHLLSDDNLADIFGKIDILVDWAGAVKKHMLAEALKGTTYQGLKLVAGRAMRKWTDEKEVSNALIDDFYSDKQIYDIKLKGIGDIEKLVGKAKFVDLLSGLVIKPKGKPTLVPRADKREEINTAKDDFK